METKKPWLSKTLWLNAAMALTALCVPVVNVWLSSHTETVVMAFTLVNMLLRLVSKDKIALSE